MVKSAAIFSMVKYVTIVCERSHMVWYVSIVCIVKSITIIEPFTNCCYKFNHSDYCYILNHTITIIIFLTIFNLSQTIVTYLTILNIVTNLTILTIVTNLTILTIVTNVTKNSVVVSYIHCEVLLQIQQKVSMVKCITIVSMLQWKGTYCYI